MIVGEKYLKIMNRIIDDLQYYRYKKKSVSRLYKLEQSQKLWDKIRLYMELNHNSVKLYYIIKRLKKFLK